MLFLQVSAMFKVGTTDELPIIPSDVSDDMKDFITICLRKNPSHRPTSAELLYHPLVYTIEKPMPFSYGYDAYTTMLRSPNYLHMKESTFQGSQSVSPINQDVLSNETIYTNLPRQGKQVEDLREQKDDQSVFVGQLESHGGRDDLKLNMTPNLIDVPSYFPKINDIQVRDDPIVLPEIIGFNSSPANILLNT